MNDFGKQNIRELRDAGYKGPVIVRSLKQKRDTVTMFIHSKQTACELNCSMGAHAILQVLLKLGASESERDACRRAGASLLFAKPITAGKVFASLGAVLSKGDLRQT